MNNDITLPQLKGSEKQVAWAEKIRSRMLNYIAASGTHKAILINDVNGLNEETLNKVAFTKNVRCIGGTTETRWFLKAEYCLKLIARVESAKSFIEMETYSGLLFILDSKRLAALAA